MVDSETIETKISDKKEEFEEEVDATEEEFDETEDTFEDKKEEAKEKFEETKEKGKNIADNVILPIDVQSKPLSVRHLTKAERHTIRSVSVVPSQDGLAVRFCRKNGGEDFLPLEEGSNACAWDNVKPRRLQIVTYDDGKERVRILPHRRSTLFHYIWELWATAPQNDL